MPHALEVRTTILATAALALAACTSAPPPPSASASPAATAAPTPMTVEQGVEWYKTCWGLFNTKAWDTFQNCYTKDATSDSVDSGQAVAKGRAAIIEAAKQTMAPNPDVRGDLQLIVANGRNIASVALWKGTNTAPMPGPDGKPIPPTGKAFSFLMAHTLEWDAGMTAAEADAAYVEVGTMLAQLGLSKAPARKPAEAGASAPTVVIAANNEAETANVAAVNAELAAFNKHDIAGVAAALADNYMLHEIALPADTDKKKSLASTRELFGAFADVKLTTSRAYGAGDYVVVTGTFEGTNTGPLPAMGIKQKTGKHVVSHFVEIFRLEKGKIAEDWLFYNGAAFAGQLGLM